MDQLLTADTTLFFFFNHLPHSMMTDSIARFFSLIGSFGLIWICIGGLLILREEHRHRLFIAPILSAIITTYVMVEWLLKPLVGRARPYLTLADVRTYTNPSLDYFSFPSGHAAIAFAMAVVLSGFEPKLKRLFYVLALCISFSRMYLGVHYPLDVLSGGVLGWSIGTIISHLFGVGTGRRFASGKIR